MAVNTRADLKQYILECLGAPLIDINVTDNQIENMIDDSLLFFQEYYWDGLKRGYYSKPLDATEASTGVITIPDYIYNVSYIYPVGSLTNIKMSLAPLSAGYNLLFGALQPGSFASGNLVYFEQVMEHLSLMQNMFVAEKRFNFNRLDGKLHVIDGGFKENDIILMDVWACHDLTQPNRIWGERMFKQYATAKVKLQWAQNLSKYQGMQLPGGITVDASSMNSQAQEEIDKLEEFIKASQEPLQVYIG